MYSQKVNLWYCKYIWNYNTDQLEIWGQYLHNKKCVGDAVLYSNVITNPRWRAAAILKIAKSPYLSKNRAILIKFGTLQQILNPMTVTWPKIEILKFKMAATAILKIDI